MCHRRTVRQILRRLAWSGLLVGVAVWHHHNHRFRLSLGDKVVEDACCVSEFKPRILIASASVQQIQHGIFLPGLAIVGRQVDRQAAVGMQSVGVIPHLRHRTVSHIAHLIVVGASSAYIKNAEHRPHVAPRERIGRV